MNKFLPNPSSVIATLAILAIFFIFGGFSAIEGDWQTVIIWGGISSVVIALLCVVNFFKETQKEKQAAEKEAAKLRYQRW